MLAISYEKKNDNANIKSNMSQGLYIIETNNAQIMPICKTIFCLSAEYFVNF